MKELVEKRTESPRRGNEPPTAADLQLLRRLTAALVMADAARRPREYVENYRVGRGAE